jgi:hypothetical protein
MNTEIEKEVIGILLNHPEKLEAIPLESDWFGYPEYRMLFEAMRKSASHDLFDVYGKYNQLSKTPLDFSAVKSMRNEFTLVSQLNNDIQLIRKSAYNRQLNSAIAEYQANPSSENEQALLGKPVKITNKREPKYNDPSKIVNKIKATAPTDFPNVAEGERTGKIKGDVTNNNQQSAPRAPQQPNNDPFAGQTYTDGDAPF